MMCAVMVMIPLGFILVVHAQEPTKKQISDSQDFMNKLFENLFDRTFKTLPLHHTDLEQTTLAKTPLGIRNGGTTYATLRGISGSPFPVTRPLFPVAGSAYSVSRHHNVIQAAEPASAEVTKSALSPQAIAAADSRTASALAVEKQKKRIAPKPKIA